MRTAICVVVVILISSAGIANGQARRRGKAPFENQRDLMRGSRCQIMPWGKSGTPEPREGVFGDVKMMEVTQTVETHSTKPLWVVTFTDFNDCHLSFWGTTGQLSQPSFVEAISSY